MRNTEILKAASLKKSLDKLYNFDKHGVCSFGDLIEKRVFVSKFTTTENSLKWDRHKYNRMNNNEQREWNKKANIPKTAYYLRTESGGLYQVSKGIYDYAQVTETEPENSFCKYD